MLARRLATRDASGVGCLEGAAVEERLGVAAPEAPARTERDRAVAAAPDRRRLARLRRLFRALFAAAAAAAASAAATRAKFSSRLCTSASMSPRAVATSARSRSNLRDSKRSTVSAEVSSTDGPGAPGAEEGAAAAEVEATMGDADAAAVELELLAEASVADVAAAEAAATGATVDAGPCPLFRESLLILRRRCRCCVRSLSTANCNSCTLASRRDVSVCTPHRDKQMRSKAELKNNKTDHTTNIRN